MNVSRRTEMPSAMQFAHAGDKQPASPTFLHPPHKSQRIQPHLVPNASNFSRERLQRINGHDNCRIYIIVMGPNFACAHKKAVKSCPGWLGAGLRYVMYVSTASLRASGSFAINQLFALNRYNR
ncbi:hypothetical protein Trisim1_012434 [Trichoderma cf. simile WF8]